VRDVLPTLPTDHYDCVVTSPPYWGLRDYGVEGQIGLEPTMQGYLDTMVGVCRELRRVLKPEGTFWLNIGDSYSTHAAGKVANPMAKSTLAGTKTQEIANSSSRAQGQYLKCKELPEKNLCMIPNRLAILLQEDGWYVRSEIIWHKPNPMPESVRDRPTSAHEKVWLLTKSQKYFYDADAIAEQTVTPIDGRGSTAQRKAQGHPSRYGNTEGKASRGEGWTMPSISAREGGRNARNVWSISPKPFKGAHFATMPPELAERCIKAGCPEGGTVLDPFGGSGTTGMAAQQLKRNATLIELNEDYIALANRRTESL
jgi:DNA modification methylase